ncbi:uncharacterized protein LOC143584335 [Bidens hawaiensis]|uniref:uncharacterized protein LOC143584335 n=1 Tax=Bidens hawaiensis TaxID=980011 RepID=UPI00404A7A5B
MDTLEGNWCRGSHRRKLVAAADIVNVLPDGWKIEIAIHCRAGLPSLHCRNYVSPTGMQFKSCKDVAVYLKDKYLIDVAGPSKQGEMRQINNGSSMLLKSINEITSCSTLNEANNKLLLATNDLYDVEICSHIECTPCGLTFDDIDGLNKHLEICHKKTTRIFELPKKSNTSDKAQTDCGQNAVVGHDERQLGEASSSSQRTGGIESPVININNDGTFRTECIWCHKEFLSKPVDAESMADAVGFLCPQCVEILCGRVDKSLSKCKML